MLNTAGWYGCLRVKNAWRGPSEGRRSLQCHYTVKYILCIQPVLYSSGGVQFFYLRQECQFLTSFDSRGNRSTGGNPHRHGEEMQIPLGRIISRTFLLGGVNANHWATVPQHITPTLCVFMCLCVRDNRQAVVCCRGSGLTPWGLVVPWHPHKVNHCPWSRPAAVNTQEEGAPPTNSPHALRSCSRVAGPDL